MTTNLLLQRVKSLKLYGLLSHWEEICGTEWLESLITWEETERSQRSLQHRLKNSSIGRFKSLAQFDWSWPKNIDRDMIEELMQLEFIKSSTNIVLCGPNGVGKSTIACNIAHQAVLNGHTVLFTTASKMLSDLASQNGDYALSRKIKFYINPALLVIDEIGYLSYSNRYADLLFEIISRRYQSKSTMITTNKAFGEWGEIFANASCTVSLIDRLVHNSEIINIEADSFRFKEAKEKSDLREKSRVKNKAKPK
jgi:DNA replication protein DnaC